MIKNIELIFTYNFKPIILLTFVSLIFRLIEYDFDINKSLVQVLTIFLFATFASFMIHLFRRLYYPNDSFFNWWWKIYGFMILMSILRWLVFGEL